MIARCDVCATGAKECVSILSSEAHGARPAIYGNAICIKCLRPGFVKVAIFTKQEKRRLLHDPLRNEGIDEDQ